jgi:hypothetical protein
MTFEEKQKALEEQAFKKKWAKFLKLSPIVKNLSKTVGKAPKCNTKEPKKEIQVAVANNKNKKKR